MYHPVIQYLLTLLLVVTPFPHDGEALAQSEQKPVPEQVRVLAGTYVGAWLSFGIDKDGNEVKRLAWTDTMTAVNPVVFEDRAFVTTSDRMFFSDGSIPDMTMPGSEGYFLNEDGSFGDYYFEMYGQTVTMQKLGENSWAYTTPASPQELMWLGFPSDAEGEHVMIKVVTYENGVETHRISRVSTITWTDADKGEQWVQYTSLKGYHKRI